MTQWAVCFKARLAIRCRASITITRTAALMPKNTASTKATLPNAA